MNQKHTTQVPMALPKLLQRLDVMVSVFTRWASRFHTTAMHDQKHQHIDRAGGVRTQTPAVRSRQESPDG